MTARRQAAIRVLALTSTILIVGCPAAQTRFPQISGSLRLLTRGDTGEIFNTTDQAAIAACRCLRSRYPAHRHYEFAGCIFKDQQGIKVGLPETIGDPAWCKTPEPPSGTILLADYHNHLVTDVFSTTDQNTSESTLKYLCTPTGEVLRFTPDNKTIVRVEA